MIAGTVLGMIIFVVIPLLWIMREQLHTRICLRME